MGYIEVAGKRLELNEEGFLKCPRSGTTPSPPAWPRPRKASTI